MSIQTMRSSRNIPQAGLITYNYIRGKNPEKLILVFEGLEDQPYYETMFNRIGSGIDFQPIIAKGKDQVLGLRELLRARKDIDENIRFFVDRDFDILKGHEPGPDIYVTDDYSIENSLVSKSIFKSLLSSEFKCSVDGNEAAQEHFENLFDQFLEQFFDIMHPVNQAIFHARQNGYRLKNIEDNISKYINISLDGLNKSEEDHFNLIGWPEDRKKSFEESAESFNKITPHSNWRGKFLLGLFVKILALIKEDRTSSHPRFFTAKNGIKFDPNGENIRTFASLAAIPNSLVDFVKNC